MYKTSSFFRSKQWMASPIPTINVQPDPSTPNQPIIYFPDTPASRLLVDNWNLPSAKRQRAERPCVLTSSPSPTITTPSEIQRDLVYVNEPSGRASSNTSTFLIPERDQSSHQRFIEPITILTEPPDVTHVSRPAAPERKALKSISSTASPARTTADRTHTILPSLLDLQTSQVTIQDADFIVYEKVDSRSSLKLISGSISSTLTQAQTQTAGCSRFQGTNHDKLPTQIGFYDACFVVSKNIDSRPSLKRFSGSISSTDTQAQTQTAGCSRFQGTNHDKLPPQIGFYDACFIVSENIDSRSSLKRFSGSIYLTTTKAETERIHCTSIRQAVTESQFPPIRFHHAIFADSKIDDFSAYSDRISDSDLNEIPAALQIHTTTQTDPTDTIYFSYTDHGFPDPVRSPHPHDIAPLIYTKILSDHSVCNQDRCACA
jgi:hypothetical protein